MTGREFREVDHDLLADYVGGALDGTPERDRVARLVAEDAAWADAHATLAPAMARVHDELTGWGAAAPEMPLADAGAARRRARRCRSGHRRVHRRRRGRRPHRPARRDRWPGAGATGRAATPGGRSGGRPRRSSAARPTAALGTARRAGRPRRGVVGRGGIRRGPPARRRGRPGLRRLDDGRAGAGRRGERRPGVPVHRSDPTQRHRLVPGDTERCLDRRHCPAPSPRRVSSPGTRPGVDHPDQPRPPPPRPRANA